MITVGLTGPTGAGKSVLAPLFAEYGFEYIDCDRLARRVTEPRSHGLELLAQTFGREILLPDGSLDRPALAKAAFSTPEGRKQLNSITHPLILGMTEKLVSAAASEGRSSVIDAPLLFESGFSSRCTVTVSVIAETETRIARLNERDGLSRRDALLRISAQQPCIFYASRSTYPIANSGSMEQLMRRARRVIEDIIKRYDS